MMSRGFLGMPGVAAAPVTPPRPSSLALSGGGSGQKWAVSSRGGECSPDCCCPTGISCHDRTVPPEAEQSDDDGCSTPMLTTPLKSKGDFETLD
jgi:hypothetical protein